MKLNFDDWSHDLNKFGGVQDAQSKNSMLCSVYQIKLDNLKEQLSEIDAIKGYVDNLTYLKEFENVINHIKSINTIDSSDHQMSIIFLGRYLVSLLPEIQEDIDNCIKDFGK